MRRGPETPVVRRPTHVLEMQTTKGHTNPRIASRKHHFRTDEFSAVVALGDTTRGACCWTPNAALAERACLGDIRWPEYLAVEALPHCCLDERVQTYAGGLHRGTQSRANFWSFPVNELTRPRL